MTHILIAAFDHYADAERVKHDLLAAGLPADALQLSASSNPETVAGSRVEVARQPEESLGEKVSGFFHSLFGEGHPAHLAHFPEAMRRGSTLFTVTLDDESRIDEVEQAMTRHGAIDVDERAARWGERNPRPATASTEALTTGYPDATSVSTGLTEEDRTSAGEIADSVAAIPGRSANARAGGRDTTAGRVRIVTR